MQRSLIASLIVSSVVSTPFVADAQVLGTFRWQLEPFCNVVNLDVTRQRTTFTLHGFDDQCGAGPPASIVGTAFLSADGSVAIGLTTVVGPSATPVHVDARIDLASLGGTWRDSGGSSGTFAFRPGQGTGGALRPVARNGIAPGSITAAQIAAGVIGMTHLAPGSVGPAQLAPGVRAISGGVTLANTDWVYPGSLAFSLNSSTTLTHSSRVATIPVPGLTQAIIDGGSVEVYVRPVIQSPEWTPLPFRMVYALTTYILCIDVRYAVGEIRLHYTHQDNAEGAPFPPPVDTDVIADLPVRWIIRPGGM